MRFLEFIKSPPNIHSELERGLAEGIDVRYPLGFIGDPKDAHGEHLGSGIFDHGDGTYSYNNGSTKVKFKNQEAATDFAEGKRSQYKKHLIDAHADMTRNTNVSDDDTKVLRKFTDHLGDTNHKLLAGATLDTKTNDFVSDMDGVISRHSAPSDMVVYSGTNDKHAKTIQKGGVVNHPAYLSTSISTNSARAFANQKGGDILKIHVPKGHPGVYVSHLSGYEGEREFVLPRNTKLKIHKDKEQVLMHDSGTFKVHHATIVNDNDE